MPPKALKSHFGASGEVLQRFARGIDEREVEPPTAAIIPTLFLRETGRQLDMMDGFTAIQTGRTLKLKDVFAEGGEGYTLNTPSLSR